MRIRTKIEKFTEEDFNYYFQLVNDAEVMAMITERPTELAEAKSDFKKLLQNNQLNPDFGNFKILNFDTNDFLGLAKLEIKNEGADKAELGYMILPQHWGKGIASTVGIQLVEVARTQKAIKRIFAIIDPKNVASRKVLINNGFFSKEFKDFDGLPGEILERIVR